MYELLRKFKWTDGVILLGVIMLIVGVGISYLQSNKPETKVEIVKKLDSGHLTLDSGKDKEIVVEVAGEVIKPGVYKLAGGSRVNDALTLAGGTGVKADKEWMMININRAALLSDGQKIYIPSKTEALKTQIKVENSAVLGVSTTSDKININSADVARLDALSGVGPAIAQKIIDYRNNNNGFKRIEEIKLVSGIGEKLFEKIKDQITL